ncbi:hypothetical protein DXG01_004176 [Tephrocybe rancida]|nr:hypothetical protein DXG01_004176 [Tephrocybe rancida]
MHFRADTLCIVPRDFELDDLHWSAGGHASVGGPLSLVRTRAISNKMSRFDLDASFPTHLDIFTITDLFMARGGTPLGFGAPSLEASNQGQIDDLVQRNRTLEHTHKKLLEQIALEKAKANGATAELQTQWKLEKTEWRQGCDVLQSCHRVVQLRNMMQLGQERMNILKEQDVTRKEKLLRLQRDFRITMFQAREAELEDRIRELEEDREAIIVGLEEGEGQHDQRIAEFVAVIHAKDEEIAVSEQAKEEVEDVLAKLREAHARLQGDGEQLLSQLERVTLQRDGAITARDELKSSNEELTRAKAELLRQIEKWQSLETKGGAEVETERKKRVELEIQVRDLQAQLGSAEEHEKLLRKEKRKVEKLKENLGEWQAASEKHGEEIEAASSQLAKAERKIAKLEAALAAERERARSPSPQQVQLMFIFKASTTNRRSADEQDPAPQLKPRSRRAQNTPSSKLHATEANAGAGPSETNKEETEKVVKKRKRKAAESDVEEISPPIRKVSPVPDSNGKELPQKSKSNGKGKAMAMAVPDEEVETASSQEPRKAHRKNKNKAANDEEQPNDDMDVVDSTLPTEPKKAPPSEPRVAKSATKAQRKPPSRMRSASAQPVRESKQTSDTENEPAKKKRRKINIFPSQAEPFSFEAIPIAERFIPGRREVIPA